MILEVYVEDQVIQVDIPEMVLEEGQEFFDKMDKDMDKGWKMGPTYIEHPDTVMRAQIAADKLLTAMDTENKNLLFLMAGYIVTRMPGTKAVKIDPHGEPLNTEFL